MTYRAPFLFSAAVLALAISGPAAADYYHADNTERGVTTYPEHNSDTTKTRADADRELVAAQQAGVVYGSGKRIWDQWTIFQSSGKVPGKTREQVEQELRSQTPAQKQQWVELYGKS